MSLPGFVSGEPRMGTVFQATNRIVFRDHQITGALSLGKIIDGCRRDAFSMGELEKTGGQKYNSIVKICEDAEHVEKFMAISKLAQGPTNAEQLAMLRARVEGVREMQGPRPMSPEAARAALLAGKAGLRIVRDQLAEKARIESYTRYGMVPPEREAAGAPT